MTEKIEAGITENMSASFFSEKDPFQHFANLLSEAEKNIPKDPNAMQLATVNSEGQPSVRTVLMKGVLRGGVSFYTNYEGRKAQDLAENAKAAVNFYWPSLDRQIRIEGVMEKMTEAESEAYFQTRPRLSQIGAWASQQSQSVPDLETLDERVALFEKRYLNQRVPKPPHWGGYLLMPLRFEFWFARVGRLHERYIYRRNSFSDRWITEILSP